MSATSILLLAGLLSAPSFGQKLLPNGKPDLSGKWELKTRDGVAVTGAARLIEQGDEKIRIRASESGKSETTELDCGTRGQECTATVRGSDAKVTLWYNGNTLVEMARIGKDEVVETRRAVSDDGSKLTVTVTTLAPSPKDPEVYEFGRVADAQPRAAADVPPTK